MKNKKNFQRFLIIKGNTHNPFHMKINIVLFPHTAECSSILTAPVVTTHT